MSEIILEGHIIVSDDDLPAVLAALPEHIRLTRQEAGCLVFRVTQRPGAANIFDVYEVFSDRDAFELHQRRVSDSVWGRVAARVTRHYTVYEG